ncbi:NusG domain II-containing protein [Parasulfuritortus cantonensis]|uniref:NusG domain II-containing protein n=1 Tax=Parasulfuritortus cantonensis TaxID=2528202 RepID=A0A4R1BEE5_9PROT|nr:NusG domain II-containing protein [Parasulfuritortus cantonensis]
MRWYALLRPGDWLILALTAAAAGLLWNHGSGGDRVLIKQDGRVFLDTTPRLDREVAVSGPLGETVVEIRAGRVRVKSDPGPHQVCVKQGWLMPGQVAICLPNRVSVERGVVIYDSLNY